VVARPCGSACATTTCCWPRSCAASSCSGFAQTLTGQRAFNADQVEHGDSPVSLPEYVTTGHWVEATFENWESEFLQMGAYVLLTVWLRQKGSAESKPLDEDTPQDEDPRRHRDDADAPWPVRRGGLALAVYEHTLRYSAEQVAHGSPPVTTWQFVHSSQFWFRSFQNWQSEFLAVASIIVLSIYLRERGSPESKPVHAPHAQTSD
jgi:hypothetical protein